MKRILRSIGVLTVSSLLIISQACKKQNLVSEALSTTEGNNNNLAPIGTIGLPNPFNKSVGAAIEGSLGDKWIANYNATYGTSKSCTLNPEYLSSLVSKANCVGIALYYGLDNKNIEQLLPIGIDVNGNTMKTTNVTTSGGTVTWTQAWQWIAKHSGAVNAHFFGCNTFIRLNISSSSCKSIVADFAVDDKGKPQVLLTNPWVMNAEKQYEDRSHPF